MTCPSSLTRIRYADGDLAADDAAAFERHRAGCPECRRRVAALIDERAAIRRSFTGAEAGYPIPAFAAPPTLPALLVWSAWGALAAWAVNLAWLTLDVPAPPLWLEWLAPSAVGTGVDLTIQTVLGLLIEGAGVFDGVTQSAGLVSLLLLVAAFLWLLPRGGRGPTASLCLAVGVLGGALLTPGVGHAFELRRDEQRIVIAADETVDDTLVVMAENIQVDGHVTGDLIALGERVTVRGRVDGSIVGMAEALSLEGEVGGNVLGMGETVDLRGASVGANAYGMGRTVIADADTTIAGNAALAANEADMNGSVGRDLIGLAERVTLLGSTGRTMRAYAKQVEVGSAAAVGGDLIVRVSDPDGLQVDAGATVGGETRRDTWPEERSRYASADHYLGEVLQLAAAFVTGLVLFYLFPGLRQLRLDSGAALLTAGAYGAVALIAVPALAAAVVITLIGVPLGLAALALWLAAVYAAGIVAAAVLGRRVLDDRRHRPALTLLVGLVILYVLINLPWLGGLLHLLATLLGLGLIALWLRDQWSRRSAA